ncbi:hypothetical protein AALO_G00212950 [Alosa alosa]|uniref:Ig-like domain-containing protein n=1 Tax=Alosa alosa TaxID=278164 RepID=A0AAV6G3M0_9TELE|nr:uncharacterized protein LOC125309584 isoform X1 [Alosa alosa]KAG5268471.1 hypothetical protein AALO_G00212950 [Alosa alosa]
MNVLFVVAALVLTLGMTEAATPLEIFTHEPGSNIHLKCLTNKDDQWDDLMWNRTSEKEVKYIGCAAINDVGVFKINVINEHFKLHRTIDNFILNITNVRPSDSGTYCCVRTKSTGANVILNVAVLVVKEKAAVSTSGPATTDDFPNSTQCVGCRKELTDMGSQGVIKALGGSLGLCVTLIVFLGYLSYKRRVCKHCREKACQVQQDTTLSTQNACQDDETLNYAPVHFAKTGEQQKRMQEKNTSQPQEETLYAGVKYS